VVNLSPDKSQVLHEAFRVLRPGGRLAISDVVIDGDLDDLPVSEAQVRGALSWAGCIAGALTVDQYRTLLAQVGFHAINVTISHHYSLEALDQSAEDVAHLMPAGVAHRLAQRFASALVEARRPTTS
jgi:ubiquinone/menaquinone biosynthesis C-methylase UbiE